MDNNYKFYNLDKVNYGEILVKHYNGDYLQFMLKDVMDISIMPDFDICENFKIDLVKIRTEINGKSVSHLFKFCEDLPIEICGWKCNNLHQLEITITNLIPVI